MKTIKEEAKKLIDKLPDEVTWDDIMAELYFSQQVEQGMKDVAEGRVYSHDQVKKMVTEWRKSSGRLQQKNISVFPKSGRVVPEFGEENLREIFFHKYRIVYSIIDDNVTILAIVHGAMDIKKNRERDPWDVT